jgi:hypothetical protein
MKTTNKTLGREQRLDRVIIRGEVSDHSHIVVGDATITRNDNGEIEISVGNEGATLRHLLESLFVESGQEVWTKEHADIELTPNHTYSHVQQKEYDPYADTIREVRD